MYIVEIQDSGARINLIYNDGSRRSLAKNEIEMEYIFSSSSIAFIRTNREIYTLFFDKITSPVEENIEELYATINGYLSTTLLA